MKRTLGVLLFPNFETLDVFGPLEMFGQLQNKINIVLISEPGGPVQSAHGQRVLSDCDFNDTPPIDFLLIPGGVGTREEIHNIVLLDWIKTYSAKSSLILSVCTGAALLAKTGLLDGLEATTNKLAFDWVRAQGPNVIWKKHARWVDAGRVITSAGVSAGIDMSLHVISRLYGNNVRDEISIKTEYLLNNNPNIDPFSK